MVGKYANVSCIQTKFGEILKSSLFIFSLIKLTRNDPISNFKNALSESVGLTSK